MKLIPLKPSVVIRILIKMGFECIRQKGSHMYFKHSDGRCTVVPFHKGEDIPKGLIKKILHDIEIDWENFIRYR